MKEIHCYTVLKAYHEHSETVPLQYHGTGLVCCGMISMESLHNLKCWVYVCLLIVTVDTYLTCMPVGTCVHIKNIVFFASM